MTFRALQIDHQDDRSLIAVADLNESVLYSTGIESPAVDVEIAFSAINFKDAMISERGNKVARLNPIIPGIDLAGTVVASDSTEFAIGESVIVHGYGLGVSCHGGFSQRARVPASWVVPVPSFLDLRSAAGIGTAGFTAVASVLRLGEVGILPSSGPIAVTGASGGVGSFAIAFLRASGYEVIALTRKTTTASYLKALGASKVEENAILDIDSKRPLGSAQFAGAVDCVGGDVLAAICRNLSYRGAVAASGLTAGTPLSLNVFPFIVRGVSLLGIDSVEMAMQERRQVWSAMEPLASSGAVDLICDSTIDLDGVPDVLTSMLAGHHRGRTLIDPNR